jgi:hypothetical protein
MAIPNKERAANLARINRVITTISTDLTIHGPDLKEEVQMNLEATLKFYQRKQESLQNLTETLSA